MESSPTGRTSTMSLGRTPGRVREALLSTVKESYDKSVHDLRAISGDLSAWMGEEVQNPMFPDALRQWEGLYDEIKAIELEWLRLLDEEAELGMRSQFAESRRPFDTLHDECVEFVRKHQTLNMNLNNSNYAAGDGLAERRESAELIQLREEVHRLRQEMQHGRGASPVTPVTALFPDSRLDTPPSPRSCDSSGENLANKLVSALSEVAKKDRLPRLQPEVFAGDPLKFPRWWRTFQLMADSDAATDSDRLLYLSQFTTGDALDVIEPYLSSIGDEDAYDKARKELFKNFGDRVKIAESYRKKLRDWPSMKHKDANALKKYSNFLQQCKSAMATVGYLGALDHPEENAKMAAMLPPALMDRWNRTVVNRLDTEDTLFSGDGWRADQLQTYPDFAEFCKFVAKEARVADGPCVGRPDKPERVEPQANQTPWRQRRTAQTFSTEAEEKRSDAEKAKMYKPKCLFCKQEHYIDSCTDFIAQSPVQKRIFAKQNRLCFGCLRRNHIMSECTRPLSHLNMFDNKLSPPVTSEAVSMRTGVEGAVARYSSMVVPVIMSCASGDGLSVCTYAMLDTQSDSCFIREDLVHKMGAEFEAVQLKLTTMGNRCSISSSIVKNLSVRGFNEDKPLKIEKAYTRPDIPASEASIPRAEEVMKWEGLEKVARELHPYQEDWGIGLLVGYSCWKAFEPQEVISTREGPFGVRTPLGWSVVGPTNENHAAICYKTEAKEVSMENIRRVFDGDFDVKPGDDRKSSGQDEYFLKLMKEKMVILSDGRIQLPLPVKPTVKSVPDSKHMALKRFRTLQRKFARDPEFKRKYVTFIEDMLQKNHAEEVPVCELSTKKKRWYLPHQGVTHPRKPGKVRVVFDGSASVDGVSLNSILIPGPDLCNGLLGVLCRFRMERVAFTCDIEGMFLQVKVDPEDRDLLRFFWAEDGDQGPVKEYRVNVHLFGATSSPSCATYALRTVADQHKEKYGEETAEFIRRNFYVDDGLRSEKSSEAALKMIHDSHAMCKEGQFNLCKYVSNDPVVSDGIPEELRPKPKVSQPEPQLPDLVPIEEDFVAKPPRERAAEYRYMEEPPPLIPAEIEDNPDVVEDDSQEVPELEPDEQSSGEYECKYIPADLPELMPSESDEVLAEQRVEPPLYEHPGQIADKQTSARIPEMKQLDNQQPGEVTLGMGWYKETDEFGYHVKKLEKKPTRRGMLSQLGSVYDPLGLISPVLLTGRNILQKLCKEGMGWDEEAPEEIQTAWRRWYEGLQLLHELRIRRCFRDSVYGNAVVEFHVFCDASDVGYGCCAYILLRGEDSIDSSLVMAKSRVHPTKAVTTPRMELQAAVLGVRMKNTMIEELPYTVEKITFYTDSMIVLGYIQNDEKRVSVYVRNRVREIRDASEVGQWKHVSTDRNPADLASRGLGPAELIGNQLWFHGPVEIMVQELAPVKADIPEGDAELRKDPTAEVFLTRMDEDPLGLEDKLEPVRDWHKMKVYVAWWRRYCINKRRTLRKEQKLDFTGPLTVEELNVAGKYIVKSTQMAWYAEEYVTLRKMTPEDAEGPLPETPRKIGKKSRLYRLNPYLSDEGLLRIGGRLSRADLPESVKHPLILPAEGHVTAAIIRYYHDNAAHVCRSHTLSELRNDGWWVVRCRRVIDKVISKCYICRKWRGKPTIPRMSDLPEERLEEVAPFSHVGTDMFGPVYIKEKRRVLKRWGCLFTCLGSRAVHIEMCNSLTTSSFMNAVRRMTARRGKIRTLRSDRGTNLVGLRNELAVEMKKLDHCAIGQRLSQAGCDYIRFQFNPPHTPHMGGIWERMIQPTKRILGVLLAQHKEQLDDEGLNTVAAEVEAIINSRPVTFVEHNDAEDLTPLTPMKLLTLKESPAAPPPGEFPKEEIFSKKMWRRVQHIAGEFWSRWRKEYLPTVQRRVKWEQEEDALQVDDIVLVSEPNVQRCSWPLGKILRLNPSKDGRIRSVQVKIGYDEYDRPVKDLVLLHREAPSPPDGEV